MRTKFNLSTAALVVAAICFPVGVYLGIALFVNYQVNKLTPTKLRDCDTVCSCCIRCVCQAEKRRVVESPSDRPNPVGGCCPCPAADCWCADCKCAEVKKACTAACPCKGKVVPVDKPIRRVGSPLATPCWLRQAKPEAVESDVDDAPVVPAVLKREPVERNP